MKLREILDTVQKIYPFEEIVIEYLTYDHIVGLGTRICNETK